MLVPVERVVADDILLIRPRAVADIILSHGVEHEASGELLAVVISLRHVSQAPVVLRVVVRQVLVGIDGSLLREQRQGGQQEKSHRTSIHDPLLFGFPLRRVQAPSKTESCYHISGSPPRRLTRGPATDRRSLRPLVKGGVVGFGEAHLRAVATEGFRPLNQFGPLFPGNGKVSAEIDAVSSGEPCVDPNGQCQPEGGVGSIFPSGRVVVCRMYLAGHGRGSRADVNSKKLEHGTTIDPQESSLLI